MAEDPLDLDAGLNGWLLLADAVLAAHVALVLFVVLGLVLVVIGNLRGWPWVNGRWFRTLHLATIAVVIAESWLGIACPLTTLELWLRVRGGGPAYGGGFVQHWLQQLLYWDAPAWAFGLAYTAFGAVVAWTWWRWPPAQAGRARKTV